MTDATQTMLEMVNHVLTKHPALAPAVEELAARAQGKDMQELQNYREWAQYKGLTTQQVFTRIYQQQHWGRSSDPAQAFFSGSGSHRAEIVGPYVAAVQAFLASLPGKPDVLDLGCGDFSVGSRLRAACGRYVACDIVEPLIEHNRKRFAELDVDFRVLDLSQDELPRADVVFIRQVLQHLSNAHIAAAVRQIQGRFAHLVLTEHLPAAPGFPHNLDKPAGGSTRLGIGSGVVLTSEPFKLRVAAERVLCEVPEHGGLIRTTLYALES